MIRNISAVAASFCLIMLFKKHLIKIWVKAKWTTSIHGCSYGFYFFLIEKTSVIVSHAWRLLVLNTISIERKHGSRYSKIDQAKFVKDGLWKIYSDMVCQTFKSCLPQILLGSLSNTLTHISSIEILTV